jgi:hypothetical protein
MWPNEKALASCRLVLNPQRLLMMPGQDESSKPPRVQSRLRLFFPLHWLLIYRQGRVGGIDAASGKGQRLLDGMARMFHSSRAAQARF